METTAARSDVDPCPSCGAPLGGRAACQRAFDELSARSSTTLARAGVHNLLVDTYCLQHSEEYGRSAKSYIMHLTGLCCAIDAPSDQRRYWNIPRWLDGTTTIPRPRDIASRGAMTVADAHACENDEQYAAAVRAWARAVWEAYSAHHHAAREWLQQVRGHLAAQRRPARYRGCAR
jgi:hypothetical protein